MSLLIKLREHLLGKSLDPFNPSTRHSIVLVSFLAWIGLGADGLSSCYDHEEAFLNLGSLIGHQSERCGLRSPRYKANFAEDKLT